MRKRSSPGSEDRLATKNSRVVLGRCIVLTKAPKQKGSSTDFRGKTLTFTLQHNRGAAHHLEGKKEAELGKRGGGSTISQA